MNRTYASKIPSRGSGTSDYGELCLQSGVGGRLRQLWNYSLLLTLAILFQANIASAQVGKAMDFNGSTDYIQAPAGVYFNGDFTVEAWVYPRANMVGRIFDFGAAMGNNNVLAHFGGGTGTGLRFAILNGTAISYLDWTGTIPLNQWSHLAFSLNGTTGTIYINGQVGTTGTLSIPQNVTRNTCFIGNSNWNDGTTNGKIDEFRIWNVARTQAEIQSTMNTALTGNEANLQLYYNMENVAAFGNGQSVPDVAATLSGAQNGTTVGGSYSPTITALNTWGNALHFDGANDYFTIGAVNTFNSSITNNVTVEAWVKPDNLSANMILIQLSGFEVSIGQNGGLGAAIYGNSSWQGANITAAAAGITTGKWTHIAVSYNSSQVVFYVNGVQVGTGSIVGSVTPASISPNIGRHIAGIDYFAGAMDEIRIWNVTRTAAQIQSLIYSNVPLSSSGLLAYYTFNQGTANGSNTTVSSFVDSKGGANGTPVNFALSGNTSNLIARTPIVNTPSVSTIGVSNATVGANYIQSGTNTLEEKGMVWGTTNNVSLSTGTKAAISGATAGAYSATISNLNVGQKYYYKGYAYSNDGIGYTALDSFTTLPCIVSSENIAILPTPTGANVSWTNSIPATAYSWRVVESGLGVNGTATASGTTNTTTAAVAGLLPNKNYDFYVLTTAGSCTGTWSSARAFSTTLEWNNALHFDGVNDYFTIGTTNTFNSSITTNLTLEAWVKPDNLSSGMIPIHLSGAAITITQNGGLNAAIYGNSNWQAVSITSAAAGIVAGQWSHIAVSYNGTLVTFYVNGRQVGTGNITGNVVAEGIAPNIGRHAFSSAYYFAGAMDEIRIWNVTRTAAQIQSGMNSALPTSTAGLLAYYPLNEGVPNSANSTFTTTDIKSGANGTLNNFTLTGNTSNWIARSPFVNTTTSSSITLNTATIGATYNQAGTSALVEKGLIWGTTKTLNFSSGTKVAVSGATTGAYTTNLTGLAQAQKYYYRGYAYNNDGLYYSAVDSFTTLNCVILAENINVQPSPTSANIAWTTTAPATAYSWRVVESGLGVNGTATASGTTSTTSATVTGLSPAKSYDLYVLITAGCTGGTWSSAFPFSTTLEWNNALHFDGVNDYFTIGTTNTFNSSITTNLTLEAWVKPDNLSSGMMPIQLSGADISITQNGGLATSIYANSTWQSATVTPAAAGLVAGKWAHIAITYNGSLATFYVNGRQVGTGNITGNVVAVGIAPNIGRHSSNLDYFVGAMDELRIWNVTRTAAQIQSGMNSAPPTSTTGLLAYYPLNEGIPNSANSISTTTDIKAGINGTLNNFALTGNTSNWIARAPYVVATSTAAVAISPTLTANLMQGGTATILEKGFIWENGTTTPTLTVGTKALTAGTTTGAYSTTLTGLVIGQTYTARAYAISTDGYSYSSPFTFLFNPCSSPPALNTISATNIGDTTATISWSSFANSHDWLITPSGLGMANAVLSGNSTSSSAAVTGLVVGSNYDIFVRGNCGTTQSAWQGPVTFQTTSSPSFTSSSATNDAYVQLNWILRPQPCLINSGIPYSQGIYVKLTDQATGQVLKQEPITDLTPFIGAQQPAFNYVAGDSANAKTCTIDNTSGWISYGSSTWTIETWVKGGINSTNAEIFKAVAANTTIIQITGTVISIQKNGTTTNFSTPLPLGKWKHLAFTYNGGTVALFVDGEKKEEKNISGLIFTGASTVYSIANNFKNIQMGEIRYWNRVRTDVEIANNRWNTSFNALGQNNLLLHLRWNTNNAASVDLATAYDGQNNTVTYSGVGTLQTLPYITTPDYTSITGSFRHYVGPSKSKTYKLEVFQIGSGAAIPTCTNLTASGSTIAFQQPTNATATTNLLDRVRLQWTNKSKLSETFKIFRGGALRAVIAGSDKIDSVFVWEDKYSADDSLSIVNGTAYSYCIETYCNTLASAYTPQTCRTGNTINLNFAATDGSPSNKVNLSWANVASYGYNIQIKRDGVLIATLPAATVTYADASPIYGKVAKYEVVLVNPSTTEIIVSKADNGSVPARGSISGRAVTLNNSYAIKNVRIKLHSLVDTTVYLTTYTDYLGNFAFNNLYYDINGQFEVSAAYGNHVFIQPLKTVTLNDANFAVSNLEFLDSTGLTVSATPLAVANFVGTSVANQDKINFAWGASLSAGDTVLYDIYREANRIATLTNLTNALSFADLTGEPNVSYKYKLNAYRIKNGMISAISLADTVLFPQVANTTGFAATANATSGVVNMTWSHASSNYDGFRVYRNGKKIAEIPAGTFSYTDADAKPGTSATYILKSKRFVNNITFESLGQTVSNVNVPALPAVTGVTATASTTRNSILVSWTIPTALTATYNYDGFRVYRRLSSAAATTDVYIGQLPKGINPAFEDKNAIPSTAYTYTVKGYLRLSDNSLGESAGASANATCPVVTTVTALTASTTLAGEVALAWTAPASTVRNLDGILVTRGTDTLAVLPYNANTYRAFTNNTVSTSYSVRVFRNVAGVRRFSAALSASGKAATAANTLEFATNASATQNLANHIRLSWD